MTLLRMRDRFAVWQRAEPRIDAWASYGALAVAGLAVGALAVL